jgi:hypothetical protein
VNEHHLAKTTHQQAISFGVNNRRYRRTGISILLFSCYQSLPLLLALVVEQLNRHSSQLQRHVPGKCIPSSHLRSQPETPKAHCHTFSCLQRLTRVTGSQLCYHLLNTAVSRLTTTIICLCMVKHIHAHYDFDSY